jgi:rfaE bifunctional protein nucleotidyltransferase chain/domain
MILANDLEALVDLLQEARANQARLVMAGGCFDLLHVGHVRYLKYARSLGDVLVVAVNGDEAVRQLKGPGRPIMPQHARAEILESFSFVDLVYIHPGTTMRPVLLALQPDVYAKGQDYAGRPIPWQADVEAYGGKVCVMPGEPTSEEFSTSTLIARMFQTKEAIGGHKVK